MRQLYTYFLKVRLDLKILLALAIITYFLIELLFNNYSELFNGASKIGHFFSELSISYISAFVFYFIVVHIKNEKDKYNINEFVGHEVYSIITKAHLLIQPLQQKFDKNATFKYMEPVELQQLLVSINRTANEAPYIINERKANWIEWYEYLKEGSKKNISNILIRYNHLDSRLIKLLTRIENSLFFLQFNLLYDIQHDNSLAVYQFQIQTYLSLVKELEAYADKNFKQYQYINSNFIGKHTV